MSLSHPDARTRASRSTAPSAAARVLLLVTALATGACSGGTGTGSSDLFAGDGGPTTRPTADAGPVTKPSADAGTSTPASGSADAYCARLAARAAECNTTLNGGVDKCKRDVRCALLTVRNATAVLDCTQSVTCSALASGQGQEACFEAFALDSTSDLPALCAKKASACGQAIACERLAVFNAATAAKIRPCFDRACGDLARCVAAAAVTISPDCLD